MMNSKTTENIYKQRLRAFLEGLEMGDIENLLELKPDFLRELAVVMKELIQDLK